MFKLPKKQNKIQSVPEIPPDRKYVIRASICTGEKVAGYMDEKGKFIDIMLIQKDSDIDEFCRRYNINKDSLGKIY